MSDCAILQENYRIRHHECGPDQTIKLQVLFDYFQDIAAQHADQLGFGLLDLQQNHTLWVLSRLKLRVRRRPRLGDTISLTTYPAGCDKLFAMRHFKISVNANPIVIASSAWLVLDAAKMRPLLPNRALPTPLPENPGLPRYFEHLGKIAETTFSACSTAEVEAGDIDLNCHLNNAVYARYIENVLAKIAPQRELAELQINFLRAAPGGTIIPCGGKLTTPDEFVISGGNPLNFMSCGKLQTAKSAANF